MRAPYFIGIDIGSQGTRVSVLDSQGNLVTSSEKVFPLNREFSQEQSPIMWWDTCLSCLHSIRQTLNIEILREIIAISVTSTSGSVVPLDNKHDPLHNVIMYSDNRSEKEARLCKETATKYHNGYTGFNTSSGLSKMVWYVQNYPKESKKIALWCHAADFIIGKLSGEWGKSDHTNVLKSGYDVRHDFWPDYLFEYLPIKRQWMPDVEPSGTPVAKIKRDLAKEMGLSHQTLVVAGMTDGCASQIASGAVKLGDWNTTIGTTLVVKGVTEKEIVDPQGRLYSHRHPDGYWMPGGASNTGADWITKDFGSDLEKLNDQASGIIPTGKMVYPLDKRGERFPFVAPQARGFVENGISRVEQFTAGMEGVAYIERYAYEMIQHLSGEQVKVIYTAGGGSNSDAWLTIRSNVLNIPVYKMKYITGAVGAAILAASKTYYSSVIEAANSLTQIEKEIYPEEQLQERYNAYYGEFLKALAEKGYIVENQYA